MGTYIPANTVIENGQSNDTSDIHENWFVIIIPFQPPSKWFAAQVVEVNDKDKKIKLDWLHTDNDIDFNHKDPGFMKRLATNTQNKFYAPFHHQILYVHLVKNGYILWRTCWSKEEI